MSQAASPKKGFLQSQAGHYLTLLVGSTLIVHLLYAFIVLPMAARDVATASARAAAGEPPLGQTLWIILKDPEQEIICILTVVALFVLIGKWRQSKRDQAALELPLVDLEEGERILPDDALTWAKHVEDVATKHPEYQSALLVRSVTTALRRFHSTASVQESSAGAHEQAEAEGERFDSELSGVRYLIWAIPSVGFIGTVRGIGVALSYADEAVKGNLSGVTNYLGVAFNSTLVALLSSLLLMLGVHILQNVQESLILDVKQYVRDRLVRYMKIPARADAGES